MAIGAGTVVFGANEIVAGATGSTWHINQNPYWKISSGALGKMWFDYITGLRFYP